MDRKNRIKKATEHIDKRTETLLGDMNTDLTDINRYDIINNWIGDLQYIREILLDINKVNKKIEE